MKICFINNLYKPYIRGGAERVVEMVADGLIKAGYEVMVITTKPYCRHQPSEDNGQKIYYLNGAYYNLNKISKVIRLFWHLADAFSVRRYFQVKSILKREQPDIVMTHNLKGVGMLIPHAVKSLKIKHLHTLHDIQLLHPSGLLIYGNERIIDSLIAKVYQTINRILFSPTKVVISPSQWLLNEHIKRGFFKNSDNLVLPNPIATVGAGSAGTASSDKFKFLYVGQVEEHKGVYLLIESFKEFLAIDNIKNVELAIIGKGSGLDKAKRLSEAKGHIIFLDSLSHQEVIKSMQTADCLVVPSLCYENSPTVIYEALTVGLPVIGVRLGGIPELINDPAFLFSPGNKKDLVAKMRSVLKNKVKLNYYKSGALGSAAKLTTIGEYCSVLIELVQD